MWYSVYKSSMSRDLENIKFQYKHTIFAYI